MVGSSVTSAPLHNVEPYKRSEKTICLPSILFNAERHISFLGNSKGLLQVRMVSHSHFPLIMLQPEIRFSLHGSKPSSWSSSQSSSAKQLPRKWFAHLFIQRPCAQTHTRTSKVRIQVRPSLVKGSLGRKCTYECNKNSS